MEKKQMKDRAASDCCALKYPILLVHGMGFRDRRYLNYWGRIPKYLEAHGARIFYGNQDSAATIEENARVVGESLKTALDAAGAEKVNIIAHSKGGLEARYLISSLGMADKVASLTTVNTPHNGSITVDKLLKLPDILVRAAGKLTDLCMKLLGDKNPCAYNVFYQFTTSAAQRFNEENPDCGGVYYQSFGFKMKGALSDITMVVPYLVVRHFEGENDGLLSERAVSRGEFHGMYTSTSRRGISHADEVDVRRMRFSKKRSEDPLEISDIRDFYLSVVSELKKKGY
ncbi:MAG: esterase/lipase family protein [Oscillospiraceae bacterium]